MNGRKTDHIKVLESDAASLKRGHQYRCGNCRDNDVLVLKDKPNHIFCKNCGHLTPIRNIEQKRGLAAPAILQPPAFVTNRNPVRGKDRRPKGIYRQRNELEQALLKQGYQVVDSQHVEPEPTRAPH